MVITINTDASFCPNTKIWGYAYWIKSDNFLYKGWWAFKNTVKNSTDAEIKAISNALFIIWIQWHNFDYIIINRDSIQANWKALKTEKHRLKDKLNEQFWFKKRKIEFRHVKAHTEITDARTYVNDWCDKKAKSEMRAKRDNNICNM